MLALAAYRATLCPHCSGNLAETTDPANERAYASEAVRCHKCTSQAVAALPFQQDPNVTAPHAILFTTRLRR